MADIDNEDEIEYEVEEGEPAEIEIVDDTPDEDKGRKPLEVDPEQEDEIDNYSASVKKRVAQLTHRYHDERRAKEALQRQNEEAVAFAQKIYEEHEKLKQTLSWGQQAYLNEVKAKIEYAEKLAEDRYRKAYESGDTDGVLSAQKELQEVAVQRAQLGNFNPVVPQEQEKPLQQQNNPVYNEPERIRQPEPEPRDEKAEDWAARNPWFGSNKAMTESAYIIHRRLVSEGYDTQSDEYYEAIDSSIRKAHPEHFTKQKTKSASPVAPVGRSKPATKIRLTATQVALAKRMNIPLQQYAEEFARLEKSNV